MELKTRNIIQSQCFFLFLHTYIIHNKKTIFNEYFIFGNFNFCKNINICRQV